MKNQFVGMNIKQKMRLKIQQINIDVYSNQILLKSIDCLFYIIQIEMSMFKDLMLENTPNDIIKNCNVIINGEKVL